MHVLAVALLPLVDLQDLTLGSPFETGEGKGRECLLLHGLQLTHSLLHSLGLLVIDLSLFSLANREGVLFILVADYCIGGVIQLQAALTLAALPLSLLLRLINIHRFTLLLVRGLKAVSFIRLTVDLHLLPLYLPLIHLPLLLTALIIFSPTYRHDIFTLALEFLIDLCIDDQLLFDY